MTELKKWQLALLYTGGILMVVSLIARLFYPSDIWSYLFLLGTLLYGCIQMLQRYNGKNVVIRRLRRIQIFSDLALILSGLSVVLPLLNIYYGHRNEWLIFFSIGAVLQLYTSFRLSTELEKEK